MKNQFFADKHDYFKYDLWLDVAERIGTKKLTLIPMLTPSDTLKKGRKISYVEGKRRKRLYGFLQFCLVPQRRSVTRLREFLCDERFKYHPYRDEDDEGFQDGSWDAYFKAIPQNWLCDAAILIDPDTGLEPNSSSKKPEHVAYSDVENVVRRCSGNSVVLIVQFLLQGNAHLREEQLKEKTQRLQDNLCSVLSDRGRVRWIGEKTKNAWLGDLAFFAIGTGSVSGMSLERVLGKYRKTHDLHVGQIDV